MINSVGYANPYVYSQRPISFKSQQVPSIATEDKKDGMSKTSKTLLGLGAAAAIIAGGILAKKRIDMKAIEKVLIKSEDVNMQSLNKIADEWYKAGKLKGGDEILYFPKKIFLSNETLKNSGDDYIKFMRKVCANMSDNGFVALVQKADGVLDFSTIKYLSPKNVSDEFVNRFIKNNTIGIRKVDDDIAKVSYEIGEMPKDFLNNVSMN